MCSMQRSTAKADGRGGGLVDQLPPGERESEVDGKREEDWVTNVSSQFAAIASSSIFSRVSVNEQIERKKKNRIGGGQAAAKRSVRTFRQ